MIFALVFSLFGLVFRQNRGVETYQAPGHTVASNCPRDWYRFDSAASTLILQRFLARPRNLVF